MGNFIAAQWGRVPRRKHTKGGQGKESLRAKNPREQIWGGDVGFKQMLKVVINMGHVKTQNPFWEKGLITLVGTWNSRAREKAVRHAALSGRNASRWKKRE